LGEVILLPNFARKRQECRLLESESLHVGERQLVLR